MGDKAGNAAAKGGIAPSLQVVASILGILVPVVAAVVYVESNFVKHGELDDDHYTAREIDEKLRAIIAPASAKLPEGTLLLSDSADCPAGWSEVEDYEGAYMRVASAEFPARTKAGTNSLVLTVDNLPTHSHPVVDGGHAHTVPGIGFGNKRYSGGGGAAFGSGPDPAGTTSVGSNISIGSTGASKALAIEPRFVTLKLCKADA